eukprot:4410849-Pleurochrysis_carterae.AAC.1
MLRYAQRARARVRGGQVGTEDSEAVGMCKDEGLGADGDDAEEYAGGDEGDEARHRDGRAEGTGADACGGGSVLAWARAGVMACTARSSPGQRWSWYARVAAQVGWPVGDA